MERPPGLHAALRGARPAHRGRESRARGGARAPWPSTTTTDDGWSGTISPPEQQAEYEAADQVRDDIRAGRSTTGNVFTAEQKAGAGVLLYIGHGGKIERVEGLVRKGDPVPGRDDAPADGSPRTDPITGREVAAEQPAKPKGYSQGLAESITELRNGVLRRAVRDNPEIAQDLITFNLLCSMRAGHYGDGAGFYPSLPLSIRKEYRPILGVKGASAAIEEHLADPKPDLGDWWDERQPIGVLFERYRALPEDAKAALTADLCVSVMFSMPGGEQTAYDCHAAIESELAPDYAARLRDVDPDVFSVETFWSRLRKDQILTEARECLGEDWVKGAMNLKKGELAADAAKRMKAHPAWLPKGFQAASRPERDESESA